MKFRTLLGKSLDRRSLVFSALVLVLTVVLAAAFRDYIYDLVVVPLLYLIWLAGLMIGSIPQVVIWVIFVAVALRIALGFLGEAGKRAVRREGKVGSEERSPVMAWTTRIEVASRGNYSKWRLARQLAEMAVGVLAQHERLTPEQTKLCVESSKIDVPSEIRDYLLAGWLPTFPDHVGWFGRLRRWFRPDVQPSPLDLDPEKVVRFLETQMGVRHDDADR